MKNWKKTLAMLLALVMVLSLAPALPVSAADAETETEDVTGEASAAYEPWGHGYRFVDVLNWDPATDPYSEELVASVPLQERNETYAATQANPELSDKAQLYAISSSNYRSTDVTEAPWNANMSYEEFSYNVFKFWQYADYTGAGGRPTAGIEPGSAEKEYGTIAIPMAAATNAAHKNGVKSIAEYFTPRSPQYADEMLQKAEDGSFPYADKLLEIMNYYGFDGYFINQEEALPTEYVPLMKEFLQYMMDGGAYIQWYDSMTNAGTISYQNIFNSVNSDFVQDPDLGRVSNSIFLNYWYKTDALKDSAAWAESLGLDPYETVFMGLEGGAWKYGIDLEDFYQIMYTTNPTHAGNLMQEDGQPYTSLAIWGSDFYREQYNRTDDARYKVEYQWEAEERERMYFTSPTELVGNYETEGLDRSDVGITPVEGDLSTQLNFKGLSRYIVEKSVVNGNVFATDFNNGHGLQYFIGGKVSRDVEWTNINLQDILPTWQWWIESTDDNLLDMDWDYGTEYWRVQGEFPYTQVGAYNGGSSIVIYGDVAASQYVNLYKTKLNVVDTTTIALTYNKTSNDNVATAITLIFEDDDNVYSLPIETTTGGWNTAMVGLGAYAGKTVAAIGLEFSASAKVEGFQINLGRLEYTDGSNYTPAAPTNVELAKRFDTTGEVQLTWDLADYDTVKNYHVYAIYADGSERFVGGAYAANYYIQTLEDEANIVALEVRAVGADGSESVGTQVALASGYRVSNIRTVSENNTLTVTWTDPAGEFDSVEVSLDYWYSEKTNPETVTVKKGDEAAVLAIDVEDGAQYVLSVTTVNADGTKNEPVNYFGTLADNYSDPYEGEVRLQLDGLYDLTTPVNSDWYTLEMNINGTIKTFGRFSTTKLQNISVPATGASSMVITVTDMDGNVSEPVTFLFYDGALLDMNGGYDATLIPDATLRAALEKQVGTTLEDLVTYKGALDLSGQAVKDLTGLNLVAGLTTVDLTGTAITGIVADDIPSAVTTLIVADCADLTSITLDNRPNTTLVLGKLPQLVTLSLVGYGNHELDLSGVPELKNLYLTGTLKEELDITANVKLENFLIDDSQIATLTNAGAEAYSHAYYWVWTNAKLDLTDGTSEGQLKNGLEKYFAETELEERMADVVTPLYLYTGTYTNNGDSNPDFIVDLGWTHELTEFVWTNTYNNVRPSQYYNRYNVLEATVSVSDDGENWTEVAEYVEEGWTLENYADYTNITVELPENTRGRYVKFSTVDVNDGTNLYYDGKLLSNGFPYTEDLGVNGYFIAYTGFYYAGQQPAVVRDPVEVLKVGTDGKTYQTLDLLDAHYASARTVASGTNLREIEDVAWIDADYVAEQAYMPTGVRVTITGPNGEKYAYPADTLGDTEDTKLKVTNIYTHNENSGEEGDKLFDGNTTTKWCGTDQKGTMWLVFELVDGPKVLSEWYTLHAGSESNDYIAAAYRLQTLNLDVITEEEYLAMDEAGKREVAADNSMWIDLSTVTGNSANEVTTEVPMENLVSAQVYRFVVDESGQPGKQTWGALRIYEMELYAFEGTLDVVGNGLIEAKEEGVYPVSYSVNKQEINSTMVLVSDTANAFTDINISWANDAIWYTTAAGLFQGTSATTFSPSASMTRGMIVTVLYRLAGEPEVTEAASFSDVAEGRYYTDAIAWAVKNDLAVGYPDGTFRPNAPVTRQEMVTFLYRYAQNAGAEAVAEDYLAAYPDGSKVLPYAQEAMNWAIANGIVIGDKVNGKVVINPTATATRAQLAVIFARYLTIG